MPGFKDRNECVSLRVYMPIKYIIIFSFLLSISVFSFTQATELGIGINYPGVHIRYVSKYIIEVRYQAGTDVESYGVRINKSINKNIFKNIPYKIIPYYGAEFDIVQSKYVDISSMIGSLLGIEIFFTKKIGLSFDGGLYYVKLNSSLDVL